MRMAISGTMAACVFCIASVQAGENFNYSAIEISGAWTSEDLETVAGTKKIDGNAFGISLDFELPDYPVVLHAGYGVASVDEAELVPGSKIDTTSYTLGAAMIFSPFATNIPFDLAPAISFSSMNLDVKNGLTNQSGSDDFTSLSFSIASKYRFAKNTLFNARFTHRNYNKDNLDNTNYFSVGIEYEASNAINFGAEQQWASESSATRLFMKFLY